MTRAIQDEFERLSRALRTLGCSNRALLLATDEASLLQEICRVIVSDLREGESRWPRARSRWTSSARGRCPR